MKNTGFTLFELIIVLIIMSILIGIVYTRWPGISANIAVQASALASDIRYTQNLAMTQAGKFQLVLNQPSSNNYQIWNSSDTAISLPGNSSISMPLNAGISFGSFTNLPDSKIVFDSTGTPYTDNNTPPTALTTVATISISGGGITKTISIQPYTGRVTIQ